MACAFAMIMAGADNADLSVLTEVRSEPAVPFAGKFRLIDFSLSNCVNSGRPQCRRAHPIPPPAA